MDQLCILDRWEGNTAVIEVTDESDQTHWQRIARQNLPANVQEGDVLIFNGQSWQVDEQATAARRQKMAQRLARLRNSGS